MFKAFLETHAGKGTVAVFLAVLVVLWPPALNFAVAALLVAYGVITFRKSFAAIDAALEGAARDTPDS